MLVPNVGSNFKTLIIIIIIIINTERSDNVSSRTQVAVTAVRYPELELSTPA